MGGKLRSTSRSVSCGAALVKPKDIAMTGREQGRTDWMSNGQGVSLMS